MARLPVDRSPETRAKLKGEPGSWWNRARSPRSPKARTAGAPFGDGPPCRPPCRDRPAATRVFESPNEKDLEDPALPEMKVKLRDRIGWYGQPGKLPVPFPPDGELGAGRLPLLVIGGRRRRVTAPSWNASARRSSIPYGTLQAEAPKDQRAPRMQQSRRSASTTMTDGTHCFGSHECSKRLAAGTLGSLWELDTPNTTGSNGERGTPLAHRPPRPGSSRFGPALSYLPPPCPARL
jgi:hypothetical protein